MQYTNSRVHNLLLNISLPGEMTNQVCIAKLSHAEEGIEKVLEFAGG